MRRVFQLVAVLSILVLSACARSNYPTVNLDEPGVLAQPDHSGEPRKLPLRVAIAAVVSPEATLDTYQPLLDYLSAQLDRPVQLIQRGTYAEINQMIHSGDADLAFVCGGAYVEGQREFGMEILLAPEVRSETTYYSYIIVPRNSPAQSLSDLRGLSFGFTDPLSNSGHLAPLWALHYLEETPDNFFSQTIFTFSHDNSIRAVADRLVDAAAVDSLVYDFTIARNPAYSSKTRVIDKLGPFGIPPVVVHPDLDPDLKEQIRAVLLHMSDHPEGRHALDTLLIDRFVDIDDSAYDSIREMAQVLRGWNEIP